MSSLEPVDWVDDLDLERNSQFDFMARRDVVGKRGWRRRERAVEGEQVVDAVQLRR